MKQIRIRANVSTSTKGVLQPEVTVEVTSEYETREDIAKLEDDVLGSMAQSFDELKLKYPTNPE